jgi:membrane protein YdbS with pleckstrin-like domain
MGDMANERRNERIKLLGNWCNAGSIAVITVGVIVPIVGGIYKWFQTADPAKPMVETAPVVAIWLIVGLCIHGLGHLFLEGLVEADDEEVRQ